MISTNSTNRLPEKKLDVPGRLSLELTECWKTRTLKRMAHRAPCDYPDLRPSTRGRTNTTPTGENLRASEAVHYDLDPRRRGARGETLLFLHGEDGAADHEAFLAALATRANVLAPTLPGYDLSPVPPW